MAIKVLSTELANQIAAGEVIERPASVIKELVENSIDANAKSIKIHVYEAGRKLIIVDDDGDGISKKDVLLAFKRHATSKIIDEHMLFRIATLGFRGEALPSIASIANVTLETAFANEVGTKVSFENGEQINIDAPKRKGTKVTVSELFYNTPARLKHLKLDYTENAVTLDVVTKIALAHPEISFSLAFDDRERFMTSGRNDLQETILNVYGLNTAKNIIPINVTTTDFKISGFLGNTELVRANRYAIITNLNGRNVYMPKIQAAIIDAYHGFIAPSRYPFVVLNIESEPSLVDVNVHPSKKEVRLSKEQELINALLQNIPLALTTPTFVATKTSEEPVIKREETVEEQVEQLLMELEPVHSGEVTDSEFFLISDHKDQIIAHSETKEVYGRKLRPLVQLHQTYIVCEHDDGGFCIIDQHAAHERINYEKFMLMLDRKLKTRPLLVPYILHLSKSEFNLFDDELLSYLKTIGLEVEHFGSDTLRIISVPAWEEDYDEKMYIDEIIAMVRETRKVNYEKLRSDAIATMACKASIKAKQRLSILEMEYLIKELFATNNPYSCPHGRPTIIRYTKYELEKLFLRTGT
ncbi:MAG TPA: DNA mismatch repair endonuclease MutL [Bacilli bacterium]|nr:DNA mismatch repair endonuclease MutL [Bacilli bacterium]